MARLSAPPVTVHSGPSPSSGGKRGDAAGGADGGGLGRSAAAEVDSVAIAETAAKAAVTRRIKIPLPQLPTEIKPFNVGDNAKFKPAPTPAETCDIFAARPKAYSAAAGPLRAGTRAFLRARVRSLRRARTCASRSPGRVPQ